MKKEIMRRNYEKTKLFNKNGVFSLEYDKETLRDMVLEYQEEIERLNNIINQLEKYIKESCWKDDWGVESIYVETLLNKLQELKGSDEE